MQFVLTCFKNGLYQLVNKGEDHKTNTVLVKSIGNMFLCIVANYINAKHVITQRGKRQEEYAELPAEVIPSALLLCNNDKLLLTTINFIETI
jgi:hypothetical protein